jgi:hypothetical protein
MDCQTKISYINFNNLESSLIFEISVFSRSGIEKILNNKIKSIMGALSSTELFSYFLELIQLKIESELYFQSLRLFMLIR